MEHRKTRQYCSERQKYSVFFLGFCSFKTLLLPQVIEIHVFFEQVLLFWHNRYVSNLTVRPKIVHTRFWWPASIADISWNMSFPAACTTTSYWTSGHFYCPLAQSFSTARPRPGTGPWHQLYLAARGLRKLQYATRFH